MMLRWRVALLAFAVLGAAQMALMVLACQVVRSTLWDDARERARARAAQICTLLEHEDFEAATEAAASPGAGSRYPRSGAGGPADRSPEGGGAPADHPDELLRSPRALAAFAFDGALFRIRD